MARTIEEKYEYNKKRGGNFGSGYYLAIDLYRDFPKSNYKDKQQTKKLITYFAKRAREGDEFAKGFTCGIRDAANERKARQRK